ncbi:MAG: amphi-Trp domain-containing protein [Proteobacteria bacterium]|nr:amphi-Trp domain-containing protein [Pseudomonadota bacterium]
MNKAQIVAWMEEMIASLKQGTVQVRGDEEALDLQLSDQHVLAVEASTKHGKQKFEVSIKWMADDVPMEWCKKNATCKLKSKCGKLLLCDRPERLPAQDPVGGTKAVGSQMPMAQEVKKVHPEMVPNGKPLSTKKAPQAEKEPPAKTDAAVGASAKKVKEGSSEKPSSKQPAPAKTTTKAPEAKAPVTKAPATKAPATKTPAGKAPAGKASDERE